MPTHSALTLQAGPAAMRIIQERGLRPQDIRVIAGAAGGPKWLVLSGLDRMIFGAWFPDRTAPLFLVGSSIGAWRFAALSAGSLWRPWIDLKPPTPISAMNPSPQPEKSAGKAKRSWTIFWTMTASGRSWPTPFCGSICLACAATGCWLPTPNSPWRRGLAGAAPGQSLPAAALVPLFSADPLFRFTQCSAFPKGKWILPPAGQADRRQFPPGPAGLGIHSPGHESGERYPRRREGSLSRRGHRRLSPGYPLRRQGRRPCAFSHYTDRIIPGWFDKRLTWRKPHPDHMAHVLMVSPSREFVADLPFGKIPDRNDFWQFFGDDDGRIGYWQTVSRKSRQLADELAELVESGRIAERVRPFGDDGLSPGGFAGSGRAAAGRFN